MHEAHVELVDDVEHAPVATREFVQEAGLAQHLQNDARHVERCHRERKLLYEGEKVRLGKTVSLQHGGMEQTIGLSLRADAKTTENNCYMILRLKQSASLQSTTKSDTDAKTRRFDARG